MLLPSYADSTDLAAWLGGYDEIPAGPGDPTRLLARASRVVDRLVTVPYTTDDDLSPTDEDVADALRDACCAVVEYWIAAGGEDVDRVALGGPIGFDGANLQVPPGWYSPRAAEILRLAGLRGEVGIG